MRRRPAGRALALALRRGSCAHIGGRCSVGSGDSTAAIIFIAATPSNIAWWIFDVQRDAAVGEALDQVELPQRARAIHQRAVQARHERQQLANAARAAAAPSGAGDSRARTRCPRPRSSGRAGSARTDRTARARACARATSRRASHEVLARADRRRVQLQARRRASAGGDPRATGTSRRSATAASSRRHHGIDPVLAS